MFNLELTSNNKIKVTYLGNEPLKVKFIPLLSTIRIPTNSYSFTFNCKNHWFIPNLDYTGCSIFKLEYNNTSLEYILPYKITNPSTNSKPYNVICLGLNKTGTTSLKSGLEKLGYNVMWEALGHQFINADIENGDYSSLYSIINNPKFNAYEDLPFSLKGMCSEIFKIDPKAKYILTLRDVDKWVNSVIKFYSPSLPYITDPFNNPHTYSQNYSGVKNYITKNWNKLIFKDWGLDSTDNIEQKLKDVYNSHVEEVTNFFKDKGDLMVLDVSKPNSFKQMADWLGENTNELDFPWLNKSN
jgi:hypothetical protein